MFEIGKVFRKTEDIPEKDITSFEHFSEEERLVAAMSGALHEDEWYGKKTDYSIYDMKGVVDEFFHQSGVDTVITDEFSNEDKFLEDVITYTMESKVIGKLGSIKKEMLKAFDIEQSLFIFDLNIDQLKSFKPNEKEFKELLRYPKVVRDIALVLNEKISSKEVISEIKEIGSNLLHHITLFDIFRSESLGQGKEKPCFPVRVL